MDDLCDKLGQIKTHCSAEAYDNLCSDIETIYSRTIVQLRSRNEYYKQLFSNCPVNDDLSFIKVCKILNMCLFCSDSELHFLSLMLYNAIFEALMNEY